MLRWGGQFRRQSCQSDRRRQKQTPVSPPQRFGLGAVLRWGDVWAALPRSIVSQAGLSVQETGAIRHCPRVFAVGASGWIDRTANDRGKEAWLRWLNTLEPLGELPTRFQSGYFIALRVTRT